MKIHLEAFNPCIFLSSMDSGIPVIIFNFTVTNTLSAAVKVNRHVRHMASACSLYLWSIPYEKWRVINFQINHFGKIIMSVKSACYNISKMDKFCPPPTL